MTRPVARSYTRENVCVYDRNGGERIYRTYVASACMHVRARMLIYKCICLLCPAGSWSVVCSSFFLTSRERNTHTPSPPSNITQSVKVARSKSIIYIHKQALRESICGRTFVNRSQALKPHRAAYLEMNYRVAVRVLFALSTERVLDQPRNIYLSLASRRSKVA